MAKGGTGKTKSSKKLVIIILAVLVLAAAGGAWWWFSQHQNHEGANTDDNYPTTEPLYHPLTGLIADQLTAASSTNFCVQIPNGSTDGARPQAGLSQAGVVFEAIAETGITRFAAVFAGDVNTGVIGPIRSLRPYYLDWDTPFDCTVVHDGGSPEALAAVGNGKYRNLDEDFTYMWKENNPSRLWNNVFTSPGLLLSFNRDHNYAQSDAKTFSRLHPAQVQTILEQQQTSSCEDNTEDCIAETFQPITHIRTAFTNLTDYIVNYYYDATSNTYRRSYENGNDHLVYDCPAGSGQQYTEECNLVQVSPSSVVVMRVQESTASDNYHENIQTIGQGKVYIFQNGQMIEATWQKSSQKSQITFTDTTGAEIELNPGLLWIAAVPQFGSVSWE